MFTAFWIYHLLKLKVSIIFIVNLQAYIDRQKL